MPVRSERVAVTADTHRSFRAHAVFDGKEPGCSQVEDGVPHVLLRVEAPDFVQLDFGVFGPAHDSAGNPPLSTGQTCGQICTSPGIIALVRPAAPGDDFAMSGLPEPGRPRLAAKHNGVMPAPHGIRAARYLSDGRMQRTLRIKHLRNKRYDSDTNSACDIIFRMLSALAVRRAVQIAGHLSAHRSETFSSPGVMIISYQLPVK
jgi:hypothetical protein